MVSTEPFPSKPVASPQSLRDSAFNFSGFLLESGRGLSRTVTKNLVGKLARKLTTFATIFFGW
jgi:hypothetical protein